MKLIIEIRANPERFQGLYQTLNALLLTMRKGDGYSESSIYRDIENGEIFFLAMDWEDAAKFEKFMRSMSVSALLGAFNTLSKAVRVRVDENMDWLGVGVLSGTKNIDDQKNMTFQKDMHQDLTRLILQILWTGVLILTTFWIMRPFLPSLSWAAMIVAATWQIMIRVEVWLWGKRGLAVTGNDLCYAADIHRTILVCHRGDNRQC